MMNYLSKTIVLIPFLLIACSSADIQRTVDLLAEYQPKSLSRSEVAAGLKSALVQGISKGSEQASKLDGYYKNPALKIPFPPELRKVEKTFRKIGLGSEVDKFVRQLNRGAERAAVQAKPVFVNSIKSLTIEDVFSILNGEQDAATQYLRRATYTSLRSEFLPVVARSLDEVKATRYYDDIINRYNKIPLVSKINPDLDAYATDRAIDGLFLLVAREEANIRANPAARSTELLRRVFGSQDG